MNRQKAEDALFAPVKRDIIHFAKAHEKEVFYSFTFECNADCGEVPGPPSGLEVKRWSNKWSDGC